MKYDDIKIGDYVIGWDNTYNGKWTGVIIEKDFDGDWVASDPETRQKGQVSFLARNDRIDEIIKSEDARHPYFGGGGSTTLSESKEITEQEAIEFLKGKGYQIFKMF